MEASGSSFQTVRQVTSDPGSAYWRALADLGETLAAATQDPDKLDATAMSTIRAEIRAVRDAVQAQDNVVGQILLAPVVGVERVLPRR